MNKILLLLTLLSATSIVKAQTAPGPVEKRMTDSICNCITRLDMSKLSTKDDAINAYTNCVAQHADLLPDLAEEKKVDMTDQDAMRNVGIDLAKNLMKQKCDVFMKLSVLMAKKQETVQAPLNQTTGTFKRIDLKGFNYLVVTDNTGSEKSFLWLRQFPGSENLMTAPIKITGKKIKITWQEIEAYLPQAKGYYNVKEITALEIL